MNNNWFKELWAYRELCYVLVWRDVKVKYKQSLLGAGWAVLQPLTSMIIFSLLFGRLAKMPSDGVPYPVFVYTALLLWSYVSAAVGLAANSLVSNANMITKVYFPRGTLPFASVLSGLLDLAVASVLLVALMFYYKVQATWWLALAPLFVLPLLLLSAGVGMFLAALHVRYRDVKYVLPFMIQLWLFVTPVIYPITLVPERFRPLFALNPLTGIIDGFRGCIFAGRPVDSPLLAISLLTTVVVFLGGLAYFKRTERWFADVI
jgi:lipopolysaccharide transport system permease protein